MEKSLTVINIKGKKDLYGDDLSKDKKLLYIGRNIYMGGWKLPKSKWANPFTLKNFDRETVLSKYREHILNNKELFNSIKELEGKTLACWCKPEFCHGDVLIELYKEYMMNQLELKNGKKIKIIIKKK